ncbi:hypothetical protein FQR65_LT17326 [Abscondita terminalis]|nr:hypothetical protein FQR65_LT17326 [Abscondita terminalis]
MNGKSEMEKDIEVIGEDSGEDVFVKFKNAFHVTLPTYLEHLLMFTGFDNVGSLATLDDNDLKDTIHIGTKLKTVFLKHSVSLKIEKYDISSDHVKTLIKTVSKDKHSLTPPVLNPTDKMNLVSFDKMTQENVVKALEDHVPESKGTGKDTHSQGRIINLEIILTPEQDLPSEADIEKTIGEVVEYVTSLFLEMEIHVYSDIFYRIILKLNKESDADNDMEIESDEEQVLRVQESLNESQNNDDNNSDHEEISILKEQHLSHGTLELKDFTSHDKRDNTEQAQKQSFLKKFLSSGKVMTVKKTSLCWLCQNSTTKLGNDNLLRVRGTPLTQKIRKCKRKLTRIKEQSKLVLESKRSKVASKAEIENFSKDDTSSDISVHDSSNDPDDFSDLEAENRDTTTKGFLKLN